MLLVLRVASFVVTLSPDGYSRTRVPGASLCTHAPSLRLAITVGDVEVTVFPSRVVRV